MASVSVNRKALAEALAVAMTGAASRGVKPHLENVLIHGTESLLLTCSDGEVTVTRVVTDSENEGLEVALPAKRLHQILTQLTGEVVEIADNGRTIGIGTDRAAFTLPRNDDARVAIKDLANAKRKWSRSWQAQHAERVARDIGRVSWSTDPNHPRAALGGVLIEVTSGSFLAVATNASTLTAAQGTATSEASVLMVLSGRMVTAIQRAYDRPIDLSVYTCDGLVMMTDGTTTISGSTVAGTFPDWRSVVPASGTQRLRWKTNVGALLQAVRQARVCTNEESGGIVWEWTEDRLSLESGAAGIGEGDITLYMGAYQGKIKPNLPMRVTLDGEFCQQILAAMDKDADVDVVAIDSESAVKFESGEITTIIMPMSKE